MVELCEHSNPNDVAFTCSAISLHETVPDVYICVNMSNEAAMIVNLEVNANASYAAECTDVC